MPLSKYLLLGLTTLLIVACNTNPPAPVIDRAPNTSKTGSKSSTNNPKSVNENLPKSHIVKKGDTLFAIGLEYGYDYREIAEANHINSPYAIRVGQRLVLPNANITASTVATSNPTTPMPTGETTDGVIVTPIKSDNTPVQIKPTSQPSTASNSIPVLSEPKAVREPFSQEAMNRPIETVKPIPIKVETATETATKNTNSNAPTTSETDGIAWMWPTSGKVVSSFNEASNKGIDIAGKVGQTINAASNGKVIYTGSDLRGYGKLVIIKHSPTYLSVYAHNSKIVVKEGQQVGAGQKIAEMGDSDSASVKLHFEVRRQGKSVDPMQFLPQN
jgi:lipoprotein NlpD